VIHKEGSEGLYELTYVLSMKGRYRLDVRLHGRHIPGSPFIVTCVAPVSSASRNPRSRSTGVAERTTPQTSTTKARPPITRQVPVPSGAGTKRPASSPPSKRSCSQSRPSSAAVTPTTAVRAGPSPRQQRCCTVTPPTSPPVVVRRRQKSSVDATGSWTVSRASRIPSYSPRVTRSSSRVVTLTPMDFSDDTKDRLPVNDDTTRTAKQDQTVNSLGHVINSSPPSGLVLRVGRQGRDKGEFINPQGICYSGADGGLIVVADSNCACVQVSCF